MFRLSMLLTAASAPPGEGGWALEVKWDGIRAQAPLSGAASPSTRGAAATARRVPGADRGGARRRRRRALLLDGELVCFDEQGRPDFSLLRARLGCSAGRARAHASRSPATLVVFDVLQVGGHAVRRFRYQRRRELLAEVELSSARWQSPTAFDGDTDLVAATRACGLEGVLAKRLDAAYAEGRRSPAWRKIKSMRSETLVIVGWEPGLGEPDSLLVARPDADTGELCPAGRVALYVAERDRAAAHAALARLERPRRARLRLLEPALEIDVSHHGPPDGLVRDARAQTICPRANRERPQEKRVRAGFVLPASRSVAE